MEQTVSDLQLVESDARNRFPFSAVPSSEQPKRVAADNPGEFLRRTCGTQKFFVTVIWAADKFNVEHLHRTCSTSFFLLDTQLIDYAFDAWNAVH